MTAFHVFLLVLGKVSPCCASVEDTAAGFQEEPGKATGLENYHQRPHDGLVLSVQVELVSNSTIEI